MEITARQNFGLCTVVLPKLRQSIHFMLDNGHLSDSANYQYQHCCAFANGQEVQESISSVILLILLYTMHACSTFSDNLNYCVFKSVSVLLIVHL